MIFSQPIPEDEADILRLHKTILVLEDIVNRAEKDIIVAELIPKHRIKDRIAELKGRMNRRMKTMTTTRSSSIFSTSTPIHDRSGNNRSSNHNDNNSARNNGPSSNPFGGNNHASGSGNSNGGNLPSNNNHSMKPPFSQNLGPGPALGRRVHTITTYPNGLRPVGPFSAGNHSRRDGGQEDDSMSMRASQGPYQRVPFNEDDIYSLARHLAATAGQKMWGSNEMMDWAGYARINPKRDRRAWRNWYIAHPERKARIDKLVEQYKQEMAAAGKSRGGGGSGHIEEIDLVDSDPELSMSL